MTSLDTTSSILKPGQNCWKVQQAVQASFLVDADEYFRVFRETAKLARKNIFISGWDIDSRMELLRQNPADDYPLQLGDFLNTVAEKNKDLQIYILLWDFAMLVGIEREWFPLFRLEWKTHDNIHFAMDDLHPVGASQHQKLVIIDDSLAFSGGLDLTKNRWDTPEHSPGDTRRRTYDGKSYRPHHDVQIMVLGRTARYLGDFFSERWQMVTGKSIADRHNQPFSDIWPKDEKPDIFNCNVGIARTIAQYRDITEVREVEKLYLDSIEKAQRYIYIENQYLTSPKIYRALAESLQKETGPEIIIVLPLTTDGWLSQYTMDLLRYRAIQEMRKADRKNRLGVFYAHHEGLNAEENIKIHSKLMIADDNFVRIGTANLNNRSMGLDTEIDLAIEAGDAAQKKAVADFCNRLLAEHLGVDAPEFHETLAESGTLLKTIDRLQGNERTLKRLDPKVDEKVEMVAKQQYFFDPEKPIEPERLLEHWLPMQKAVDKGLHNSGLFVVILAGVGLALGWRFTPLHEMISREQLSSLVDLLKNNELAWLYVSAAYIFGSVLVVPITALITLTLLIYGSIKGIAFSLLGATVSGAITYWLGRNMGRKTVRRLAGDKLNRISKRLGKSGVFSTFIIRLMPIAPYSIVNIVAGATHIRFRDFILGTALGLLPGILAIAGLVDRGFALFSNPNQTTIISLIAMIAVVIAAYFFIQKKLLQEK